LGVKKISPDLAPFVLHQKVSFYGEEKIKTPENQSKFRGFYRYASLKSGTTRNRTIELSGYKSEFYIFQNEE